MNMTRIVVLVAALGAAALAAFLARGFLGKKDPAANAAGAEVVEVLVAAKNINVGAKIVLTDLKWQRWPQDAVDAAYITKKAQPNAIDEAAAGSVARAPLLTGEPVTAQKVIKADGAGFLAAVLTPGHRAYSLKVNAERGAGGFILPNDRVDVIMTRKMGTDDGGRPAFDSATVLQDVRVLAIDQVAKEEEGNQAIVGKTATLEVTAPQAQALALAEAMGDITLSLRSLSGDDEKEQANLDLFNNKREEKVVIYRYGVRSQTQGQGHSE